MDDGWIRSPEVLEIILAMGVFHEGDVMEFMPRHPFVSGYTPTVMTVDADAAEEQREGYWTANEAALYCRDVRSKKDFPWKLVGYKPGGAHG